eukprot:536484-Amphidinium_carterae.1
MLGSLQRDCAVNRGSHAASIDGAAGENLSCTARGTPGSLFPGVVGQFLHSAGDTHGGYSMQSFSVCEPTVLRSVCLHPYILGFRPNIESPKQERWS